VPPLVNAILNEIEMNQLENSEMAETMTRIAAELKRLSVEPLSVADRELTPNGTTTGVRELAEQIDRHSKARTSLTLGAHDAYRDWRP